MKVIPIAVIAAIALHQPIFAQAPAAFEKGVVLNASDILPADLLRGESHRVRDQVVTDGYMAHFQIDTDFGTFEAVGVPQLKNRIVEAQAIRKLVETSKSDLFAEGMKRSLTQPVEAVKNIVTHPVDSVKQAPKTVGHFFSKVGGSIERGAQRASEKFNDQDDDSTKETGKGIGNAAKNAAGFQKAKLEAAKQLGIDPYTDNARLQEEIEKVTWAFFAGGLPLRIGAAVASAGVALAATNMVGIPEDTYSLTQAELALRDATALAAMGVREADIKAFQLNAALSTTRRHRIVNSLEALRNASGRGNVILLANACTEPSQADFLIGSLAILTEQQSTGAADYVSIKVIGRLPSAMTSTGEFHVAAPVDHVTWTEDVSLFAGRDDLGTAPKVLLHTGKLSPAAAGGLTASSWKCVGVAYPSR